MFGIEDEQVSLNGTPLSCLLYADDLVLLSTTQNGLQGCLNKLSSFCDKYCLTVNLKKTKVVIFYKNARLSKLKFTYKSMEIEHSLSYKYLGVLFNASGSFVNCQHDLYKRGLKAFFKLVKSFGVDKPNVNILIHLFDHTVKPVILYGSEIWGTINTEAAAVKRPNYVIEDSVQNMYCDKLHIKALKYICGVHKKASNHAVFGELGRHPLYVEVLANSVKYLQYIVKSKSDSLLANALHENNALYKSKKSCWLGNVYFLLTQIGISCDNISSISLPSIVYNELRKRYVNKWSNILSDCAIKQEGKLRTYALFKTRHCREKYFSMIKKPAILKCFTNFRISSHKLSIEVDRYKNIPVSDRKCRVCNSDNIEDESHFIFQCPAYDTQCS